MRGYTVFSKNTGVEILGDSIEKKDNKYGSITLRFFEMETGGKSLRFIMNPVEAFTASLIVAKVAGSANATKLSKTHKFEGESGEIITTLTFEKWVRDGKTGFALLLKRDDRTINVPVDEGTFLYVGEFLRYLSTQQAWVNPIATEEENEESEPTETEEVVEPTVEAESVTEPNSASASTPTANTNNTNDLTITGVIESVRRDGKGFKVGETWFNVNDRTKINGELKRGKNATVTYRNGNNGVKFANRVEISE